VVLLLSLNFSSVFATNSSSCLRKNPDNGVIEYDTKNGRNCVLLMTLDRTPNIAVNNIEDTIAGASCTLTEENNIQNAENLNGIIIKNTNTYRVKCSPNYYGDIRLKCGDGKVENIGANDECLKGCKISDIKKFPDIDDIIWNGHDINSEEYVVEGTKITANNCDEINTYMINANNRLATKIVTCQNESWIDEDSSIMCRDEVEVLYICPNNGAHRSKILKIGSELHCDCQNVNSTFYDLGDPAFLCPKECRIGGIRVTGEGGKVIVMPQ
jgi:hypothetical protein